MYILTVGTLVISDPVKSNLLLIQTPGHGPSSAH